MFSNLNKYDLFGYGLMSMIALSGAGWGIVEIIKNPELLILAIPFAASAAILLTVWSSEKSYELHLARSKESNI